MTLGFSISSDQGTGSVAVTKPMEWTQQQMVQGVRATKSRPRPLQGTGEASRGRLMGGGTAVRVEAGGRRRPGGWCVAMVGPRGCTWLAEERCVQGEGVTPTALGDGTGDRAFSGSRRRYNLAFINTSPEELAAARSVDCRVRAGGQGTRFRP